MFWDGRSGPKLVRSFAICPGMRTVRDHNIADESKSMRVARSYSCRNIAFLPSQHECLLRALWLGSASQHLSISPPNPRVLQNASQDPHNTATATIAAATMAAITLTSNPTPIPLGITNAVGSGTALTLPVVAGLTALPSLTS